MYENISVYNISYKSPTGPKSQRIRFDKIDGFIIFLDGKIKYFVLFDYGLFDKICNKIKYLISKNSGNINSINHIVQIVLIIISEILELIHIILCLLKKSNFYNAIILFKSVINTNESKYYYNIF